MSAEATRMQDLAFVFKIFRGDRRTPGPTAGGGDPLPYSPLPASGRARSGVGTQTLVPLNFSAVIAPLHQRRIQLYYR